MPGPGLNHAEMVKETSTTTGYGTYSLAGAVAGFRTFVAGIGNGLNCYYSATNGTDWEVGVGTVADGTPDTLTRAAILGSSNFGLAVGWGAGTKTLVCTLLALGLMQRGHLWGLTLSNAADTVNDITVSDGECRDELAYIDMVLPAAITKRLDAAWAVGTNAGGLNTGTMAADTWYEVHLIKRLDTGVVDVMFTTTADRATLPDDYGQQRRIGWIRTDAVPGILQFTQVDDHFTLTTQIHEESATCATTATLLTFTCVPPNCIARFRATVLGNVNVNTTGCIVFSEIVEGAVTPAPSTGIASLGIFDFGHVSAGHFEMRVDGNSQIEHDSSTATGSPTFNVSSYGWIDRRGRLSGT